MVEILCPHCEGEIELDDDASGEFACPLCEGEFEWNLDPDPPARRWKSSKSQENGGVSTHLELSINPLKVGREVVHLVVLIFILMGITGTNLYVVEVDGFGQIASFSNDVHYFGEEEVSGLDSETTYSEAAEGLEDMRQLCIEYQMDECESYDESVSAFERWNLAGNVYSILLGLSALLLMGSFMARGLVGLTASGRLEASPSLIQPLHAFGRFALAPAGVLWLLGTLLFVFLSPSFETTYSFLFEDIGNEEMVDTSYTLYVWSSMFLSLLLPAVALVFLTNFPLEFVEPEGDPLNLLSLLALSSSGLGSIALIGGYFFNWLVAGEYVGIRPTGIRFAFMGDGATTDWIEIFGTEGLGVIGAFGILFFLLVFLALLAQLTHTVSALAVQLDDMGIINMDDGKYTLFSTLQVPSSLVTLGCVIGGYIIVQLGALMLTSDGLFSFMSEDSIPRPSLLLVGMLVLLSVQYVTNRLYQHQR